MDNNLSIVKDQFKELPNNIEAEQAVIGSILVSNDIFDEINTIISSVNFYDPMHQKIFSAIENLIFKGMLACLLYTSPSPRDKTVSRMPSSA